MKNLKLLRERNNLTQTALSIKTGIDQALLSKYENDERNPAFENICILADYFKTSLDYIVDRTNIEKPYSKEKN